MSPVVDRESVIITSDSSGWQVLLFRRVDGNAAGAVTARIQSGWNKLKQLSSFLVAKHLPSN